MRIEAEEEEMISLREKETAKCIKPKKRTSLPELLKSLPI